MKNGLYLWVIIVTMLSLFACANKPTADNVKVYNQLVENFQQNRVFSAEDAMENNEIIRQFKQLRNAYSDTEREPRLLRFLFSSQHNLFELINKKQYGECLRHANKILKISYINLSGHFGAMLCSEHLGKNKLSKYHNKMLDGLMNALSDKVNGRTPEQAFLAYGYDDLHAFILFMELQVKSRKYVAVNDRSYDKVTVVEVATNEEFDLYFDVTKLMLKVN